MRSRVLVIGFGNELRSDDGVGRVVAEALSADPRAAGCRFLSLRQLTPELAFDVAEASSVLFVDASVELDAGAVATSSVRAGGAEAPAFTHHVSPSVLLGLAETLYGRRPAAFVVSVGVGSLAAGEGLSEPVAAAVPGAIETVMEFVSSGSRPEDGPGRLAASGS